MNCLHCNTELIWGGEHDIEDENESYSMVTNLSCPKCDCYFEVYYPKEDSVFNLDVDEQELPVSLDLSNIE